MIHPRVVRDASLSSKHAGVLLKRPRKSRHHRPAVVKVNRVSTPHEPGLKEQQMGTTNKRGDKPFYVHYPSLKKKLLYAERRGNERRKTEPLQERRLQRSKATPLATYLLHSPLSQTVRLQADVPQERRRMAPDHVVTLKHRIPGRFRTSSSKVAIFRLGPRPSS